MAMLKRATRQLRAAGINLEVHNGLWGPYLWDPRLQRQTSRCHHTAAECVTAALNGERPQPMPERSQS